MPKLRFPGFEGEWTSKSFENTFAFLSNNTLSRAELSTHGLIKNIHYGDVLIRFGDTTDASSEIPFVSDEAEDKIKKDYIHSGDVIIADTAEDATVGKATEILNVNNNLLVSGLHTIPCRPKLLFAPGFLGYMINSVVFHDQLIPFIQGIKVSSISKSNINRVSIRYPSYSEQEKIAAFLLLLDLKIEKQKKLTDAFKSYKRGLINSIIDGNIHPHKEHSPWINMTVGEAFVITRGNVLPISETRSRKSSTFCYPVYSSQTKDDGLMGFYSEYLYENCITWTTDGANAGCVKYRAGKFYCTNVCGVLLEKAKQPDYFIAEVINRISKKYVSYVGNPKLMNNVMAEISIDIPSSDESRFLSNVVKVIINRIKSEEDVLTKLETYKSGLLQTIFI